MTGEFFLTDREGHDRNVGRVDALVGQFAIERNVGVAVDGRDHRGDLPAEPNATMSETIVCQSD